MTFEISYQEITKTGKIVTKRKAFKTESAMDKFIDKLTEKDSFYQILGTRKEIEVATAQEDIDTAIECGLIEAETTENDKEENTMTQSTFTTKLGNTFSTNDKGNYFYMTDANGKKYRIKKSEYEQAKREYELECKMDADQWEAEADAERKAREDKIAADAKATEDAVNGKTRKTEEEIAKLDDAAEDPDVTLQEFCEMLSEDEKATIEPAEAELLNNVRKEKKAKKTARKPRRPKDIAYEGHGVALTAKQVDFINHLPDTCFWEMGVDSVIWCDVLVDDIGGQFAEKPMTVGAMISTLCEKHLGIRGKEKREGRKVTNFALTELGKEVAKELGLE